MSHEASRQDAGARAAPPAFDATSKLAAFLIGVVAVAAGFLMGRFNPFLSGAAARQGSLIDALFSITLGVATAVFVIVQGFLLYSIVRFGRQPGDDEDGLPIRGNTKLEIAWTAIPAITVVVIGLLSYRVLALLDAPSPDELVVEVTAIQYAWEFYYPEYDLTSPELHIPLDKPVLLKMHSEDVIHSFWVPEFRIKKDVMPDRETEIRITGTELGRYPVVCAELCGAGHAVMRSWVDVQPDAEFQSWVGAAMAAKEGARAAAEADPLAEGRELFIQFGCNTCHTLKDAGASGQIGPPLDGIGTVTAQRVPEQAAAEYLSSSILKPGAYMVERYPDAMPKDYGLRMSQAELDALVKYLMAQQ